MTSAGRFSHVASLIFRERKTGGIKLVKKKARRRHTDVSGDADVRCSARDKAKLWFTAAEPLISDGGLNVVL